MSARLRFGYGDRFAADEEGWTAADERPTGPDDDLGRLGIHFLFAGRTAYRAMRLPAACRPHEWAVMQMTHNRNSKFAEAGLN